LKRLALLLLSVLAACSSKPPIDTRDYAQRIAADRAEKDQSFLQKNDPIPDAKKGELLPLGYFPIDPEYKTGATLAPATDSEVIPFATSTGTTRNMRRAGSLEFSLKGQTLTLTAFIEVGAPNADHLFVPFADLTTGPETYPPAPTTTSGLNSLSIFLASQKLRGNTTIPFNLPTMPTFFRPALFINDS
jgi:hypothetical protein